MAIIQFIKYHPISSLTQMNHQHQPHDVDKKESLLFFILAVKYLKISLGLISNFIYLIIIIFLFNDI